MKVLRRPMLAIGVTLAVLVAGSLLALGLGADGASLVLSGSLVALAFVVVVWVWLRPLNRQVRQGQHLGQRSTSQQAGRTRSAVHAAERRLFSQLEALAWLRDELQLETPLPATRGAAAAPDRLSPGATIFVDDGDRPDEREMVRRWDGEIQGLGARYPAFAKGAWLLTMPDHR